jgi:hypothetical protein
MKQNRRHSMVDTMRYGKTGTGYVRGLVTALPVLLFVAMFQPLPVIAASEEKTMLIDDFSRTDLVSALGTEWRGVSDRVMGGVSQESVSRSVVEGLPALHLQGEVRLENNGGFIQAALDLSSGSRTLDGSAYRGIRLIVRGNGEKYSLHLRTPDNTRPWQSYRAEFTAGDAWQSIDLPFDGFAPYRLETPLDVSRLSRLGLVAIGRAFSADLMVSSISFYR